MKLFQHGYLDRIPLPSERGQPAMVHVLSAAGARHLEDADVPAPARRRARAKSSRGLDHELAVSTVLVEFLKARAPSGVAISCVEPASDALADRVEAGDGTLPIRPDGAACVDVAGGQPARRLVLFEVDRGTMALSRMESKFSAYRAWLTSGREQAEQVLLDLQARHDVPPFSDPADVKVGVVTMDPGRSRRLAQVATNLACRRLFWFCEEDAMLFHGALGAVWTPAGELADLGEKAVRRTLLD